MTAEVTNFPPRDPFFALAPELKLHLSETDGALVVSSREPVPVGGEQGESKVKARGAASNAGRRTQS